MEMILLSAPILGFVGLLLVVGTRRTHSPDGIRMAIKNKLDGHGMPAPSKARSPDANLITNVRYFLYD